MCNSLHCSPRTDKKMATSAQILHRLMKWWHLGHLQTRGPGKYNQGLSERTKLLSLCVFVSLCWLKVQMGTQPSLENYLLPINKIQVKVHFRIISLLLCSANQTYEARFLGTLLLLGAIWLFGTFILLHLFLPEQAWRSTLVPLESE